MILGPAFDHLFCRFLLHELILQPEIVKLSVVVSGHQYKKSKFLSPVHVLLLFLLNICFPAKKYYPINMKSDIVYKMIFEYVLFMVLSIHTFVHLLPSKTRKQTKYRALRTWNWIRLKGFYRHKQSEISKGKCL